MQSKQIAITNSKHVQQLKKCYDHLSSSFSTLFLVGFDPIRHFLHHPKMVVEIDFGKMRLQELEVQQEQREAQEQVVVVVAWMSRQAA
jgi:hypothetical protein